MTNLIKKVSATELKNKTSEILNMVAFGGYEIVVKKHGNDFVKVTPIATVKPKKDYNKIADKLFGSIPDFPEVYKFRKSRKSAKIFD
jgi:prevent-host-death family protein